MTGTKRRQNERGAKYRAVTQGTVDRLESNPLNITLKANNKVNATTAATVRQESCQTLDPRLSDPACVATAVTDPAKMTADELADVVIEGIKKFDYYLPFIRALKEKVKAIPRDSKNRFKAPLKGCYSWSEFCREYLDRTRQAVDKAIDEPEFSNREIKRRAFKAEHPEYANENNSVVDKAIRAAHRNALEGPTLTEQIAQPYSEELRPDLKEMVYYGEMSEHAAMQLQRKQEKGIAIAETGGRSHGIGLDRLRTQSKEIPVRHSIGAKDSPSGYCYNLTMRCLLEREVISLLQFQQQQRTNGAPKTATPPAPAPSKPSKHLLRQTKSPHGKVHVDELPPDVREKVMSDIQAVQS
jgi:hypothetical protein